MPTSSADAPGKAPQRYHDEAAIFQIDKVRTPTHIVAGANDIRVAVLEDYLLEHALYSLGVPNKLSDLPRRRPLTLEKSLARQNQSPRRVAMAPKIRPAVAPASRRQLTQRRAPELMWKQPPSAVQRPAPTSRPCPHSQSVMLSAAVRRAQRSSLRSRSIPTSPRLHRPASAQQRRTHVGTAALGCPAASTKRKTQPAPPHSSPVRGGIQ